MFFLFMLIYMLGAGGHYHEVCREDCISGACRDNDGDKAPAPDEEDLRLHLFSGTAVPWREGTGTGREKGLGWEETKRKFLPIRYQQPPLLKNG